MAGIPEFSEEQIVAASKPDLQPSALEGGIAANVQAGRRIGQFYGQEGADLGGALKDTLVAAQQHITFTQMSHGIATGAMLSNSQHQATDQVFKDPSVDKNDPTIAPRLIQQNQEAWADWAKGFSTEDGQKWAAEYAAKQQADYMDYVALQQSHWSSIATVQNHEVAVDQSAQQAALAPQQTDRLIEQGVGVITAGQSSGVVNSEDALKLEPDKIAGMTKVATAGAKGAIYNPDVTDPVASYNQWKIDNPKAAALLGEDDPELERAAEEQGRSLTEQKLAADRLNRQQEEDDAKTVIAQDLVLAHRYTDAGQVIPPEIVKKINADQVKYAKRGDTGVLGTAVSENITGSIDRTYQQDDPSKAGGVIADAKSNAWKPDWNPVPLQDAYNNGQVSSKTLKDALEEHQNSVDNPSAVEDKKTVLNWYRSTAAPMLVQSGTQGMTIGADGTYVFPTAGAKDKDGAAALAYGEPLILNLYRALVEKYNGDTAKARTVLMDRSSPEGAYPILKWLVAAKSAPGGVYGGQAGPAVPGEIGGNVAVGGHRTATPPPARHKGETDEQYMSRNK